MTAMLKSRGVCCLENASQAQCHVFQAETLDGKPVREVRKKYLDPYGATHRLI